VLTDELSLLFPFVVPSLQSLSGSILSANPVSTWRATGTTFAYARQPGNRFDATGAVAFGLLLVDRSISVPPRFAIDRCAASFVW
jgi:hypothetical protein